MRTKPARFPQPPKGKVALDLCFWPISTYGRVAMLRGADPERDEPVAIHSDPLPQVGHGFRESLL